MLLASAASGHNVALAAGKKRATPPKNDKASGPLKRAIRIDPIPSRYIELADPDQPMRVYGQNIYDELVAELKATDNFVLLLGRDVPEKPEHLSLAARTVGDQDPDPCNFSSVAVPSTHVTAHVDEISFQTGSSGNRMFYGFKRGEENPYNAGVDPRVRNEFPLRKVQGEPGWFGDTFADTGGLHTGLELGNEVNFDLLLVGARLKKAEYHASLGLEVEFRNRVGQPERRFVTTKGNGFFFDLSGHLNYEGVDYMAGLGIARDTAFFNAFKRSVKAMAAAISAEVARAPLLTRVASQCDGSYYVAAGANYRVAPGQRFYSLTQFDSGQTPAVLVVEQVFQTSARVRLESGALSGGARVGDELVSLGAGEPAPKPKSSLGLAARSIAGASDDASLVDKEQTVDTGSVNFDIPTLLKKFVEGYLTKLWNGIKALATLPYRAWRFFQYDQSFKGGEVWRIGVKQAVALAQKSWALKAIGAPDAWSRCQGTEGCLGRREIVVAVLDSGIDYNHRELRRNIYWDGTRDTAGWDFISGDERPYDDHAHGSEVASQIAGGGAQLVGAAPNVTLLPVKVFSPYGLTTSSALFEGFKYAIAMGAKIIVTAWATPKASQALEDGIKLAQANGALVVTAAGEGGEDLAKQPRYPAAYRERYENVLVVAGHDKNFALTRTKGAASNYGRIVELAAPGEAVKSANPRDSYKERTHTGVAAGLVAGAAALAWSHCPKADVATIKQALTQGAQVQASLNGEVLENKALSLSGAVDYINQVCK